MKREILRRSWTSDWIQKDAPSLFTFRVCFI